MKTPGRENEQEAPTESKASEDVNVLATQYVVALGGIDNLTVIDACITRLRLTLKDRSVVKNLN